MKKQLNLVVECIKESLAKPNLPKKARTTLEKRLVEIQLSIECLSRMRTKKSIALLGFKRKSFGKVPYSQMQPGYSIFLKLNGRRNIANIQSQIRAEAHLYGHKILTHRENSGLNIILVEKAANNNG